MSISDNDGIYCDAPFLQMSANWFERNICLIPILQPEVAHKNDEDNGTSNDKKNDTGMKQDTIYTVYANSSRGKPFYMLWFPNGQFGPFGSHFQSVVLDSEEEKLMIPPNFKEGHLTFFTNIA